MSLENICQDFKNQFKSFLEILIGIFWNFSQLISSVMFLPWRSKSSHWWHKPFLSFIWEMKSSQTVCSRKQLFFLQILAFVNYFPHFFYFPHFLGFFCFRYFNWNNKFWLFSSFYSNPNIFQIRFPTVADFIKIIIKRQKEK